jgi:hypothetical protein
VTPEEIAADVVEKSRESLASESKCGCEGRRAYCAYHYGMEDGHEFLLAALREAGYRIVRQRQIMPNHGTFDTSDLDGVGVRVLPDMGVWVDVEDGAR